MSDRFHIVRRAFRDARKDAKLDSLVSAFISLSGQALLALALWWWVGGFDFATRSLTALLPFLTFPVAFIIRLVLAPGAAAREAMAEQLEVQFASIRRLEDQLANARVQLQAAQQPVRDPDSIYQRNHVVGRVVAPKVTLGTSTVTFERIQSATDLDSSLPFEYRGHVLRIVVVERQANMKTVMDGAGQQVLFGVYEGVTCRIIGAVAD